MKILVTGYSGQLGFDVVRHAKELNFEVIGTSSTELDITDIHKVISFVKDLQPDIIIHCAAYTAVDLAEDEREIAHRINVEGTQNLCNAAKAVNSKFFYVSTDYVFDGKGEIPFKVSDKVEPIGYYGKTKLLGEQIVQQTISNHFILRISWVFGINGNNFVKTMIKLGQQRSELNVVSDQIGSPSYTVDLAKLILEMVQTERYGIYHATNEGNCSWAEFAEAIFESTNLEVEVNHISTNEYPTKAKRPANSRLDKSDLILNGFALLPHWRDALNRFIEELMLEGDTYDKH